MITCRKRARPAVLLWVGNASQALVNKLRDFQRAYGEGEPIAILSDIPLYVDFPGLKADEPRVSVRRTSHSAAPILVFSDLAQWMLKLLLAPDIKRANLIGAPEYAEFLEKVAPLDASFDGPSPTFSIPAGRAKFCFY